MAEPVNRADAAMGPATDCNYSRFPESMLIIPDHASAAGPVRRDDLGCLLSKRAYPVDCRTARPLVQLVKKLG